MQTYKDTHRQAQALPLRVRSAVANGKTLPVKNIELWPSHIVSAGQPMGKNTGREDNLVQRASSNINATQ